MKESLPIIPENEPLDTEQLAYLATLMGFTQAFFWIAANKGGRAPKMQADAFQTKNGQITLRDVRKYVIASFKEFAAKLESIDTAHERN